MEMTCESFPHESPIPEACAARFRAIFRERNSIIG
jgi:hypothetical protein